MSANVHAVDATDEGKRITVRLYESVPEEEAVLQAYNRMPAHRRAEWLRRVVLAGHAALYKGVLMPLVADAPAGATAALPALREPVESTEPGAASAPQPAGPSAAKLISGLTGDQS